MNMREQIARALWIREWPGSNPDRVSFGQPVWITMLPHADAALDALMSPTEGMIRAGNEEIDAAWGPAKPAFQVMIRAAKEGK